MNWMLAIDCSDQACSVALGHGGECAEKFTDEPRQHAQRVLPMVKELLAEAEISKTALSAIAVAIGPGSFTGLRIALSSAQAMAYSLDLPLVPVSSLEALAQRFLQKDVNAETAADLFVGLDARMGEAYCAKFGIAEGEITRLSDDALVDYAGAAVMASGCEFTLGGALRLPCFESLPVQASWPDEHIHAADVYRIGIRQLEAGNTQTPTKIEPAYLRRDAWKKVKQQTQ